VAWLVFIPWAILPGFGPWYVYLLVGSFAAFVGAFALWWLADHFGPVTVAGSPE
jgi:hypothetical protein